MTYSMDLQEHGWLPAPAGDFCGKSSAANPNFAIASPESGIHRRASPGTRGSYTRQRLRSERHDTCLTCYGGVLRGARAYYGQARPHPTDNEKP